VADKSILIVDDEENLLLLLERIFSRRGYKVATAQNSATALNRLKREAFRVAIVDVRMFPCGGVALLSEMKTRHPSMEVIMITAYPTAESQDECLKYGAAVCLSKPLDLQELTSTVETLLGTH
jgi:DNA-binding NtrC family response regulator